MKRVKEEKEKMVNEEGDWMMKKKGGEDGEGGGNEGERRRREKRAQEVGEWRMTEIRLKVRPKIITRTRPESGWFSRAIAQDVANKQAVRSERA